MFSGLYYLGYYELYPQNRIIKILEALDADVSIYIIGHSLGGWNSVHLSSVLASRGFQVKLLVTLDPVSGSLGLNKLADIYTTQPKDVGAKEWINVFSDAESYGVDDFIADVGSQWGLKDMRNFRTPDIYITSRHSHGQAFQMLTERYKGKTIWDIIITSILNSR